MEARRYVIDRYEEKYAVLVESETLDSEDFLRAEMPAGSKPGDTVVLENGIWHIDHADTEARSNEVEALMAKLKARSMPPPSKT